MDSYASFNDALLYRRLVYGTFILDDRTKSKADIEALLGIPNPNLYSLIVNDKTYFFTSQAVTLYNLLSRDDIDCQFYKLMPRG